MKLPAKALVAVADGARFVLFCNTGDETNPALSHVDTAKVDDDNRGSGGRHPSSSGNHDDRQQEEDGFAAGVADILNNLALAGKIDYIIVIAAPKTLGELRKRYHKVLSGHIIGEIAKELTEADPPAILKAIEAA
jgi:protein required for attachment to host cells